MIDFVELRLFSKEGMEFAHLPFSVVGLISTFQEARTLEENMRSLHSLFEDDFLKQIVYGQGEDGKDWAYMLYNAPLAHQPELEARLWDIAGATNGAGDFVIASGTEGYHYSLLDESIVPSFSKDHPVTLLNEYASKLCPGFKAKGYFPRGYLYVMGKLHEHGET